jgi:hypothetical protein
MKTMMGYGTGGKDVVSESLYGDFFMTTNSQDLVIQALLGEDYDRSKAKSLAPKEDCDGVVFKAARSFEGKKNFYVYEGIYIWVCRHGPIASAIRMPKSEEHALVYAGYLEAKLLYGQPNVVVTDISCLIAPSFSKFDARVLDLQQQRETGTFRSLRDERDAHVLAPYDVLHHRAIGARPCVELPRLGTPLGIDPVHAIGNWHVNVHGENCRVKKPLAMVAVTSERTPNSDPQTGSCDSGETPERAWILSFLGR